MVHGTAVAVAGRGLLILGGAGAGKSTLALELIALGAVLIADDATIVTVETGRLTLAAPLSGDGAAEGLIEARGVGLLRTPAAGPTPLALVLDLARTETERLPPLRTWTWRERSAPLILRPPRLFPAAIRAAVLSGGPIDPDTVQTARGLALQHERAQGLGARVAHDGDNGAKRVNRCSE